MRFREGVTAVIRSLGGGGAERVLTTMLNYWAEKGLPCSVITTTLAVDYAYRLHPEVRCITAPPCQASSLDDCPWDVRHLRQAIMMERNNVVLSFMEKSNLPCILAVSELPVRLILAERTDPRTQLLHSNYKKALIHRLYPLADALVVQTNNVRDGWAKRFMPEDKIFVINNMVSIDDSVNHMLPLPENFICCVGRMTPSKGFSGLISILPRIFAAHPEHSLVLLGEGPDRASLMAQVSALGLTEKVLMPGFISAPHSILKKATLFVFPSLFEGFPNALIEAMSLGIAPVSFDCPSGPSEIISSGNNGLLVPVNDYDQLAEKILYLLDNPQIRLGMAAAAQKYARNAYNVDKIMCQWDALREHVLKLSDFSLRPKPDDMLFPPELSRV